VSRSAQVILLTQASCGLCDQAKDILHRLTGEYALQITEVELGSEQGRRLAAEHGVLFAPGVLLDGAAFSSGRLSERKLRRALDRRSGVGSLPSA